MNNFNVANEHFITSCPGTTELNCIHNINQSSLDGHSLSHSESSTTSICTKSYCNPEITKYSFPIKSQTYFQNELQEDFSGIKGIVAINIEFNMMKMDRSIYLYLKIYVIQKIC